jgi:hypothetical protein
MPAASVRYYVAEGARYGASSYAEVRCEKFLDHLQQNAVPCKSSGASG